MIWDPKGSLGICVERMHLKGGFVEIGTSCTDIESRCSNDPLVLIYGTDFTCVMRAVKICNNAFDIINCPLAMP
jgi:hypothetical protein